MSLMLKGIINQIFNGYGIHHLNIKNHLKESICNSKNSNKQMIIITHEYGILDPLITLKMILDQQLNLNSNKLLLIHNTKDLELVRTIKSFIKSLASKNNLLIENINIYQNQNITSQIIKGIEKNFIPLIFYSYNQNKKGIYYIYQHLPSIETILIKIKIPGVNNLNNQGWETNIFQMIDYILKCYGQTPDISVKKINNQVLKDHSEFINNMKQQLY